MAPATEAQKRASKKWRENNRSKVNELQRNLTKKWREEVNQLRALQSRVNQFTESNNMEPVNCSKMTGAPIPETLGEN